MTKVSAVLAAGWLAYAGAALGTGISPEIVEQVRERNRERIAALEAAQSEIVAASRALGESQAQRERGVEPLPGERLGTAGGHSRLAPAYFERQAVLEARVRSAKARLDAAYAARNALR